MNEPVPRWASRNEPGSRRRSGPSARAETLLIPTSPNSVGLGNPPAFILGLGENGYGVLRSLAREGVRVCGFFTKPGEFGRYSRYCEARELPPILKDDEICRVLIESSGRYGSKPVLFPTSDHHTSILANYRGELSRHFQFHWLGAESLGRIVDKARMSGICREAGVLTPRTHVTRADENLAEFAREWSFPCLIKPNQSFDSPFPPKLKNAREVILQRNHSGADFNLRGPRSPTVLSPPPGPAGFFCAPLRCSFPRLRAAETLLGPVHPRRA